MSTPAIVNCPPCPQCPACPKCEPIVTTMTTPKEESGWFSWLPISPFWLLLFSLVAITIWWFLNRRPLE